MSLDLLFQSQGAGAGTSGTYVQDVFQDVSLPANTNAGLGSTALTNPLSQLFGNDDAPKLGPKTLWVKDAVLIQDRSKWVSNSPTYQIIFNENFPGIFVYCFGNIRLRSLPQGVLIDVRGTNSGVGVTGVLRNVMWLTNPSAQAAATAMRVTDSVNQTTIDFSLSALSAESNGLNQYNAYAHAVAANTYALHDYRVVAQQDFVLHFAGMVGYFENATADIDVFPGSTYVNKAKQTTGVGTHFALPTPQTQTGGKTVVYKTQLNGYTLTTLSTQYLNTIATGTINTNLLNLTVGTGQSFMAGMGIATSFGTSLYVGSIISMSTDTATVGPTLPIGVSGNLYKTWYAGATIPISASLFSLAFSLDPAQANNPIDPNGFGVSTVGTFFYSDPYKRFRAWGENLTVTSIDGYPVISFAGATHGFLQVDGYFQAAEMVLLGTGSSSVMHATFAVNGVPAWGQNQGFTSLLKQTIFTDAAPGWNSFVLSVGSSFLQCGIAGINFYQSSRDQTITTGVLGEFDTLMNQVARFGNAQNATLSALGMYQRDYADDLFLQGAWARGVTSTSAGGAHYLGTSTNSVLKFQFYGQNFSLVGAAGTSGVLTLDGASIAVSFNTLLTSSTLGFHSIQYTHQAGTSRVEAVDFFRPRSEMHNLENFLPAPGLARGATMFVQSDTPRAPQSGDTWAQYGPTYGGSSVPAVWLYLFGVWAKIDVQAFSDDPNIQVFFKSHGTSSGDLTFANGTQDIEMFNFSAWFSPPASTLGARACASSGDAGYNSRYYVVDGCATDGSATLTAGTQIFNKAAWISGVARVSNIAGASSATNAFGFLYFNRGNSSNNFANAGVTNYCSRYNGVGWQDMTTYNSSFFNSMCFLVNNLIIVAGGLDNAPSNFTTVETRNSSDTIAAGTAMPSASSGHASSSSGVNAVNGVTGHSVSNATGTSAYQWNGSAWSSAITISYTSQGTGAMGYSRSRSLSVLSNGYNSASLNNTAIFNGVAFHAGLSSNNSRSRLSGGCV